MLRRAFRPQVEGMEDRLALSTSPHLTASLAPVANGLVKPERMFVQFQPLGGTVSNGISPVISSSPTGRLQDLAELIATQSYLAGLGISVGPMLTFRGHRDALGQTSTLTPSEQLFVSANLVYLAKATAIAEATMTGHGR